MLNGLPQILFLSSHLPYPPNSGGRAREYHIIQRISQEYDITLVVLSKTYEQDTANRHHLLKYCRDIAVFPATDALSTAPSLRARFPLDMIRNMNDGAKAYISDFLQRGEADIVHVEGYYLMHLLPTDTGVPVLLTEQNIEYTLWEQKNSYEMDARKRTFNRQQYALTYRYETEAWRKSDVCITITQNDRRYIRELLPEKALAVVPNGIDHLKGSDSTPAVLPSVKRPMLVYVGNYGWMPNVDAALYFCSDILPLVLKRIPNACVYFIGNDPPNALRRLANEQIMVTGWVDSLQSYLAQADLFVCPMRVGGGIAVKMLEALFLHKAIVSTSVGMVGFSENITECILVRDDPAEFADAVVSLLQSEEARKSLEQKTYEFIEKMPDWDQAVTRLKDCYSMVISQ